MRIISGERGGTRLLAPKGHSTRPTLERVRESLFMILQPHLPNARVLDLFAGSGLLGLEALSRYAREATFVDVSQGAIEALRANIKKLEWKRRTHVVKNDALRYLSHPPEMPYDLIFLDPPYGEDLAARALEKLLTHLDAWLSPEGLVIVQVGKRDLLESTYGTLHSILQKLYGETRAEIFTRK